MSALKKGLAFGFLAAALSGCGASDAGEMAYSCEKDARSATVTIDGKEAILVLKQKPAQSLSQAANQAAKEEKPKELYAKSHPVEKVDGLKRDAMRFCMMGSVPTR
jgi:hypothetical protein